MCYRAKKHSSTGFTPNYDNLILSKEKQIIRQNNDLNISDNIIPIGSHVLLKNEGLLTKTDARFSSEVVGYDKYGNYLLKNMLGDSLDYGIPRHKLKQVPVELEEEIAKDQGELAEVQCILDHRVKGNKNEYLIRWRKSKETHWLSEEKFETKEIIARYWKKVEKQKTKQDVKNKIIEAIKAKPVPVRKRRVRPPKMFYYFIVFSIFHVFLVNHLVTILNIVSNFLILDL